MSLHCTYQHPSETRVIRPRGPLRLLLRRSSEPGGFAPSLREGNSNPDPGVAPNRDPTPHGGEEFGPRVTSSPPKAVTPPTVNCLATTCYSSIVLKPPLRVVEIVAMDRPPQKIDASRPKSRTDRIQDLVRQISSGSYLIPAEWVAESILTWRGRSGRRN